MLSKQFSKSVDASNVAELLIRRRLLDIKIKTVEVNCLAGISIVVSTIQWTNTLPAGVVWSISTPEEVGEVNTIGSTVQVVITSSSTQRKENLLVGLLLAVV